jgi:hypothetical protein
MSDMNDGAQHYIDPATGRLQVQSGSPGFGGALLDAIKAIVGATAPRAVVQRPGRINQAVDAASQSPQTTDLGQQF